MIGLGLLFWASAYGCELIRRGGREVAALYGMPSFGLGPRAFAVIFFVVGAALIGLGIRDLAF